MEADRWNRRAARYAELCRSWSLFGRLADRLLDVLPEGFAGDLLDLGAGSGLLSERFLARHPGARVHLLDPSPAMLDSARARLGESAAGYARLAGEEADSLEPCFDAALSNAALHLMDEARVFPAVSRRLAPGGTFAFNLWGHSYEPLAAGYEPGPPWREFLRRACEEAGEPLPALDRVSEPRVRTEAGLNQLAGSAGLELVSCTVFTDEESRRDTFEFGLLSLLDERDLVRRRGVLDRARELALGTTELGSVRVVLRRYS